MIIAGVDPGLSGAVALLDAGTGGVVAVFDMPIVTLARGGKTKREIDAHALVAMLGRDRIGHTFIEAVASMPGQGLSSTFAFGKSFGIVLGVIAALGIPYTLVPSRRWKASLGIPGAKDGAGARASQLMPAAAHHWPLVKHDGRAEAALIGFYGLRSLERIAA